MAAGRYFKEVGEHHANAATTWTDLERLMGFFGGNKRLDEITDADVASLVAWRRKHTIKGRKKTKSGAPVQTIAPATVNRSTTILLKALFTRARRTWRYQFPREPVWRDHLLKEPQERVRELHEGEGEALTSAVRDDFALWLAFAMLTGLRRNETLIRWSEVNWFAKRITTTGKGGKLVATPITPAVKAILDQCKGHHDEFVFTYVCQRPGEGQKKGKRYPITPEGAKSQWRRLRARAKVQDFRFHDLRHDVATKLLRQTGNLKLVQKALNHSDVKTTVKYAHVMDDEVAAAMAQLASPTKSPTTKAKEVG
jgi:integrase